MSYISLRTNVESIEVTGGDYNSVDLEVSGLDGDDCLKEIGISDAITFYGEEDLLAEIGEEAARKYFGIKDEE